jgi:hypothetical protein
VKCVDWSSNGTGSYEIGWGITPLGVFIYLGYLNIANTNHVQWTGMQVLNPGDNLYVMCPAGTQIAISGYQLSLA